MDNRGTFCLMGLGRVSLAYGSDPSLGGFGAEDSLNQIGLLFSV